MQLLGFFVLLATASKTLSLRNNEGNYLESLSETGNADTVTELSQIAASSEQEEQEEAGPIDSYVGGLWDGGLAGSDAREAITGNSQGSELGADLDRQTQRQLHEDVQELKTMMYSMNKGLSHMQTQVQGNADALKTTMQAVDSLVYKATEENKKKLQEEESASNALLNRETEEEKAEKKKELQEQEAALKKQAADLLDRETEEEEE